ncbi:MAG: SGNH/GDSL hydrolase family protein [Opitutaceae bacterium]
MKQSGVLQRRGTRRVIPTAALWVATAVALMTGGTVSAKSEFVTVTASRVAAVGATVPGADAPKRHLLANEPGVSTGVEMEFDLRSVVGQATPLARLQLRGVEKVKVSRPGQAAGVERGALHVFVREGDGGETLAGSLPVKPGGTVNPYTVDVTDAINACLSRAASARMVRLVVRLTGKPIPHEVYQLPEALPTLQVAAADGWVDDTRQRLVPVTAGGVVYREACLPLAESPEKELVVPLLYPVRKVIEVIHLERGESLQEGQDWIVRDGRLVLPVGSHAPVQRAAEFFLAPRKEKSGETTMVRSAIKLVGDGWYHARQIEVTYEPAVRDWTWPAARSTLDPLPRTRERLRAKAPLTVILFGDSISAGYNASRVDGVWPYQPGYGELVARRLEQVYGSRITWMNHARAGGTSAHAVTQADAQVAWFRPDLVLLAYGMNDRSPERRMAQRENLEKIIDLVRTRSPETEFVVITPMLNNPAQPAGLDPVKFIRDEQLKIDRPGIAFVDITSTQLALLERKSYLDLSGNGANHPNDFLMRIYAQRILEVFAVTH